MADKRIFRLETGIGLLLSVLAFQVSGEPLRLTTGVDSRFSDNVRRAPAGRETADIEHRLDLGLAYQSDPSRCNLSLAGDFGYAVWQRSSFDPKLYTSLDANGDCELADNLVWRLTDTLQNVTRNTQAVTTPNNIIRKNVVRTGPEYTIRPSQRDRVLLSAQYEVSRYSRSNGQLNRVPGSDRVIGSVAWRRLFSKTFNGGLSLSTNRARFVTGAQIDRNTASLTFAERRRLTQLDGSLGVSKATFGTGEAQRNTTAVVGELRLKRSLTSSADLYVDASRELTDPTSTFDSRYAGFAFNQQKTGVVRVLAVRVGLVKRFSGGSSVDASVKADRSRYLQSNYGEDRNSIDITATRVVNERLSADAFASFGNRRYTTENRTDRLMSVSTGLTYRVGRQVNLAGHVGRTTRRSDTTGPEYNENWILLSLDYQFL